MKLVSWNCERLPRELAPLLPRLGEPDVLCLQEIRVRPRDADVLARMQDALPGYVCGVALADGPHNAAFAGGRAYGVATYVRAALAPTFARVPWDREGRVLVTALPGLAIVNLYAVNGTARPYFDEAGAPAGDRHAFKRRTQRALFELAAALRTEASVVLAGDWNVSRTAIDTHPRLRMSPPHVRARAELDAWLTGGAFVDVFRQRNPEARRYTWFDRVRPLDAARVDYIVVSADLVPRVRAAEILDDPAARPGSDHAPITLELERPP